jgi:hypothetical protein
LGDGHSPCVERTPEQTKAAKIFMSFNETLESFLPDSNNVNELQPRMFEAIADTLGLDFNVFPVGSKRFRNIEFIGVDNKPITFQETRRARRALTTDDFAFGVTFTISPPIDLGDKTAESLAVLLQLGGFNFYYNNGSTATYLEAGANLQYSIFDPNPSSTIATITITGTGNTTTTKIGRAHV